MKRGLSLQNISYRYQSLHGETKALHSVSFFVPEGTFVAIVGPSGCGKTTLLNIIAGLLPDYEGDFFIEPPIGYMFQRDQLLEWRTIYKNVILGLEIKQMVREETLRRVDRMLKKYGLYEFRNAYPAELSGGMRQRAALIRTLALSPKILLLDEPFSALDAQTRIQVSKDIGKMIKEEKITTVMVTHDLSEAISMADKILVLSKRPGTIKKEIQLEFEEKVERRTDPKFKDYFEIIWREINEEDTKPS